MVKFLVLNSLLFKPKYKFLTSFKAFQKKDRKVEKMFIENFWKN